MNVFTYLCRSVFMLLAFCSSTHAFAQSSAGTVKGHVYLPDSVQAEQISVMIKGTTLGTTTDSNRDFVISNIPEGTYTLIIQSLHTIKHEQTINVRAGETLNLGTIQLQADARTTEQIVIHGISSRESEYVARMPITNLENPQVYNVVNKELIQEQVITNFNDVVKNAPGIDKLWSSTGRGSDGAAYFTIRGFAVQPTMINGIAGQTNGGLDPANIERVEIIKGPSGTLFGSSLISFGGLINIVTKKPYETTGGEVSYTTGSYGLNRISFDVNSPLNKQKTVLFRLNSAYHYENSFQDAGFKRTFFLAPSLTYKASDRLTFDMNAEFYQSEGTNTLMVFMNRTRPLYYTTPDELGMNYKRSFTSNDITIKTPTVNLFAQMSYKLSDKWVSQTVISQSVRESKGLYSYVMFQRPTNDDTLNRYVGAQNSTSLSTDIQQNFIGDFKIGGMRNRLVAGVDFFTTLTNNQSTYTLFDLVRSNAPDPNYVKLTKDAAEAKIAADPGSKSISGFSTYSVYVSDVLNITDRLLIMGSLRLDRFENKGSYSVVKDVTTGAYGQTSLSPKMGVVYQLIQNRLSIFGNYMNGYKNVAPATQPDGSVRNFKPQHANQLEAGIKMELIQNKLSGSFSYYDIYVTNITRPDPYQAGFTIQNGNVYSKGFETELAANPIKGLNIIFGYSYNNSTNERTGPAEEGRRPTNAGPQNLVNAWLSYTLQKGSVKGLGIGFGGNYASINKITNNSTTNEFIVPAYTILNGTIFYNTSKYRLALKVDNITNQEYWKGWSTIEAQMLRRVSANVTLRF